MSIKKVPCTDCAKDVWGDVLVMKDNKPLHTWCLEKRNRVRRIYTYRGM